VRWVALLFLSCLEVGWSSGEATAGMMGQTGIPLDTEPTVVRDYGFPVWLGNPVMALVCPVWLGGMAGVGGCTAHGWSAVGLGRLPGGFLWGL